MNQVMTLPVPSLVGSLETYIATVNRFPLLTAEEELRLARKLRDENDIDAVQMVRCQRLFRIRCEACRRGLDPRVAGEDGFCGWAG